MATANVAFGKVGLGGSPGTLPSIFDPFSSENITTSGASAPSTSAAPTTGNSFQNAVRIILGADGYVDIGPTPVAVADGTDVLVKANQETFFVVRPGDKVAIIDAA